MSISPTFYEQLFCTKDLRAAFLNLHCKFKLFRCKEIDAKAARKMLVKLTPRPQSFLRPTIINMQFGQKISILSLHIRKGIISLWAILPRSKFVCILVKRRLEHSIQDANRKGFELAFCVYDSSTVS